MGKKQKLLLSFLLTLVFSVNSVATQTLATMAKAASADKTVKKITLNRTQYVLKKGQKVKLKATFKPTKAKTKLKWQSSNKKIATVNAKGVVKAKAAKGKATITVKAGRKKATCKITIGTPVRKIEASDLKLTEGESAKIKVSVTPKRATVRTLTYKSNNSKIAKVNKQGKVMAVKAGTAKITITATDREKVKRVIKVTVGATSTSETNTPAPTNTPSSANTPVPTNTPPPANTPVPSNSPIPIPDAPDIHDNSEEDIQALNNGEAVILRYPDTGEISFIHGAYTDYKVTDVITAGESLAAVDSLLNVKDTVIALMPVRTETTDNGDTYYTFQQMQSIIPVANAFLKIGTDKDGNTICLSSSIDPESANYELNEEDKKRLDERKEIAVQCAEELGESAGYSLINRESALEIYDSRPCWMFYLQQNNGEEVDSNTETQYLKVYIDAITCGIVGQIFVSSMDIDSNEGYDNDTFFDVDTEMMTFKDSFGRSVELPVAKEGDQYYFVDTERKIFCYDTEKTFYTDSNMTKFVNYGFDEPGNISPVYVTVFENMRNIYDFCKEKGLDSIDGRGMPLAVGLGMDEDRDGEQDANACYMGTLNGFACFSFSDTYASIALDVAAHEFIHGVKSAFNCDSPYLNDLGAIDEAYADILGNLIEMQIDPDGADCDNWYIAETSRVLGGGAGRSMKNPHEFAQPEYIGDVYYVMNSLYRNYVWDDYGGVHTNSSILAHVCYDMSQEGIDLEENYTIWKNTLNVLTPASRFREVSEMVRFSMKRQGFANKLKAVNDIFEKAKLDQDTTSWDGYVKPESTAEVKVVAKNMPDGCQWAVKVYESSENRINITCDKNDIAKTFVYTQDNIDVLCLITTAEGEFLPVGVYSGPLSDDKVITFNFNNLQIG